MLHCQPAQRWALAVSSGMALAMLPVSMLPVSMVPGTGLSARAQPSPAAQVPVADAPDVQAAERLFSAWLDSQIAYRGLPGVAVGVVSDQHIVWSKGFGFADVASKRPMTPQTRFRIASNSKLFTAIAIMQLREAGKVRLDDPVVHYLPWFKAAPAGDDDGPITIEQLLSHSAGLQREAGDHWSSYRFPTREELEQGYAARHAAFAPAQRWKYSNLGFAIAGLVVEKVSGQSYADYIQANILDPLAMHDTSVDRDVPGLATPYGRRLPDGTREILPFIDAKGMGAATGLTSTVDDLAKFLSAQFRRGPRGGAQIVSSGSWREMLRVRSVEENWTNGTGLGFDIKRVQGRTYVGHGGGYPGNTTQTLIQLDDKVGVIVLTNTNDSNPGEIANQLMATVGRAVANASAPKPAAIAWDPAWERFAGLYRSAFGDTQVVLMNRSLILITPNAPGIDDSVRLEPLGGGRFRMVAPTGGGPVGEIVRFEEPAGKPMRLITGDSWEDRVAGQ
jgi:CubicO group peptidase (beta-lactamase class C family)